MIAKSWLPFLNPILNGKGIPFLNKNFWKNAAAEGVWICREFVPEQNQPPAAECHIPPSYYALI